MSVSEVRIRSDRPVELVSARMPRHDWQHNSTTARCRNLRRGSFVTVSFKFEAISQVECGLHTAGVDGTHSLLCDFDAKLTWRAARLTEKAARRPLELGWWPSFH